MPLLLEFFFNLEEIWEFSNSIPPRENGILGPKMVQNDSRYKHHFSPKKFLYFTLSVDKKAKDVKRLGWKRRLEFDEGIKFVELDTV